MKLDLKDTVLSTFDRIASRASLGVIGLGILLVAVLAVGFAVGGALMAVSSFLGAIAMVATFALYLAGAASLSVGALRAFDEKDVSKEMFTENILWPFLRITGANLVTQTFIMAIFYLLAYPLLLIGGFGAASMSSAGMGALAGAAPLLAVLGVVGAIAVLYVLSALMLSLPKVSIDDERMFQALDSSIQVTSGNRPRIIAAFIPFAVLLAVGVAGAAQQGILGMAVYIVSVMLSSLYVLALVTELNDRLE